MKIVITESQYKKLIKEDLGVSRASVPFTNLIYDFVSGKVKNLLDSNKKIEDTGWKPEWSLEDGIEELIKTYTILIQDLSSKYRNGFPLGYGTRT